MPRSTPPSTTTEEIAEALRRLQPGGSFSEPIGDDHIRFWWLDATLTGCLHEATLSLNETAILERDGVVLNPAPAHSWSLVEQGAILRERRDAIRSDIDNIVWDDENWEYD